MIVDVHAHYVPRRFIAELERAPGRYGVGLDRTADGRVRFLFPGLSYTRPVLPALLDLERRLDDLKASGVDHQIVAMWMDAVGYALDGETGARWSRLFNECLAEDLRAAPASGRLSGLATVPLQDPPRAAAELAHAVDVLGLRGVQIGTNVMGKNLDAAGLDPFWAAASELGVPVVLHPWHVAGEERMRQHGMVRLIGYPADTTLAAASIVFGGIADRFSRLAILLVHAGGFYPYQAGRLQRAWQLEPDPRPSPSAIDGLKWFHYDTITHMPSALRYLVELVGDDRVVLGSDAPFDVRDPAPVATVRSAGLGSVTEQRILEANPARLFRLTGSA